MSHYLQCYDIYDILYSCVFCAFMVETYKLFNTPSMDIINNVDNILMLNLLVLSSLIVSEGLRKSSPKVTNFFFKISVSIRRPIFIS